MTKKRRAKKGYVYLLESVEVYSKDTETAYKYGCTSITPMYRCKVINQSQKDYKFAPIACFKSDDIYADETKVAKGIIPYPFGLFSEIFVDADRLGKEQLICRFLKIGGCIL